MGSCFDDVAVLEDEDSVGIDNSGKSVCNHDGGFALAEAFERLLDKLF